MPSTLFWDLINIAIWIMRMYVEICLYGAKIKENAHFGGQPHCKAIYLRSNINKLRKSMSDVLTDNIKIQSPKEIKISTEESILPPIYKINMNGNKIHKTCYYIEARTKQCVASTYKTTKSPSNILQAGNTKNIETLQKYAAKRTNLGSLPQFIFKKYATKQNTKCLTNKKIRDL